MTTTTNGLASSDLGIGSPIANEIQGETEEERKRRLQLQQQRQQMPGSAAAMTLGMGGLGSNVGY